MSVADCLAKIVASGQISKRVADQALAMHKRMQAEFAPETGPASAEAAAALTAARALEARAAAKMRQIAAMNATWKVGEQRILEHPYGRNVALNGMQTKDPFRDGSLMKNLPDDHPVKTGLNVDYHQKNVMGELSSILGGTEEPFKPSPFKDPPMESVHNFIYETFGVSRGEKTSAAFAKAYAKAVQRAQQMAEQAGKIFEPNEDWRLRQTWESHRVARVKEGEYVNFVKNFSANPDALKLWDHETGSYVQPGTERETNVLRRAYSDIKTNSGAAAAFSKERRTFQFQPGEAGAKAYIAMQKEFGVGDNLMAMSLGHLESMAKEIALSRVFGPNHQATFAALLRLVKEEPGIPQMPKRLAKVWAAPMASPRTLELTQNGLTGRGNPVANETWARVGAATRDLVGMASLRNLPTSIVPGDIAMTFLGSHHNGMSGFRILSDVFRPGMTKAEAAHLQIAAHGYMDFINNGLRLYDDELNYSGFTRKVSRAVVKATLGEAWTTNIRRATQTSMLNQIAEKTLLPFNSLDDPFRNFLLRYGLGEKEWGKIRDGADLIDLGYGARYMVSPGKIPPELYERLMMAVREQSAYMAHQPDARTIAIARQGLPAGSFPGEILRMMTQYKQFTLERMTTHLTRGLIADGLTNKALYLGQFTLLSMLAGAVSIQAKQVLKGEDPQNMSRPGFWVDAFATSGTAGIYSDMLSAAKYGNRSKADLLASFAGPVPNAAAEAFQIVSPFRELPKRKSVFEQRGDEALKFFRDHSPATWYTKLATDRLLHDQLQMHFDSDYRRSFRRSEQNAQKFTGADFFWPPGENAPERGPNLGTALGR